MIKFLALVLLGFLLVSCNQSSVGTSTCGELLRTEEVAPPNCALLSDDLSLSDDEVNTSGDLPDEAFTFNHNVTFYNTSAEQEEKILQALEIIKKVVSMEKFRERILNHTYDGKKMFVDNGGLTNAQIYRKILDGSESLQRSKDNEMDMEIELYFSTNSTVGYTYASSKRVWVNTKFFDSYTAAGVAHNLFHEWLHKLGFTHASSWSSARDHSVPYSIGYLVGELGRQFL